MDSTLRLFLEAQARYFQRLADVNAGHAEYIKGLLGNGITVAGGGTGPGFLVKQGFPGATVTPDSASGPVIPLEDLIG